MIPDAAIDGEAIADREFFSTQARQRIAIEAREVAGLSSQLSSTTLIVPLDRQAEAGQTVTHQDARGLLGDAREVLAEIGARLSGSLLSP